MKKSFLPLIMISALCLCTGCKSNNHKQDQPTVEKEELNQSQEQNETNENKGQDEVSMDEPQKQEDSLMWTSRKEVIPGYEIEDGYINSVPILQSEDHPEINVELDMVTGELVPLEYDRYPEDGLLPVEAFFAGSGTRIVLQKQNENTYAVYYKDYGEGIDGTDDKDWNTYEKRVVIEVEYNENGEITSIKKDKE